MSQIKFMAHSKFLRERMIEMDEKREKKLQAKIDRLIQENKELKNIVKKLSDIADHLAHEISSPLNSIAGSIGLINDDPDNSSEYLTIIRKSAAKALAITRYLVFLSKKGKVIGEKETVYIREIIREIDDYLRSDNNNNIVFSPVTNNVLTIAADPIRIREVFNNLIVNAVNHHDPKKEKLIIAMIVEEDPDKKEIVFRIKDNGKGIPPEKINIIFKKGFSGRGSHGLGLAICRKIVEAHGGKIWAESAGEKHGATFFFTIPK